MISPLSVRYSSEPILLRVYGDDEGEGGDDEGEQGGDEGGDLGRRGEAMTMRVMMKVSVTLENFSILSNLSN
jgi:hypothetical protein